MIAFKNLCIKETAMQIWWIFIIFYLYFSGHKVLIFSQMTTMLDIVQDYLGYCGIFFWFMFMNSILWVVAILNLNFHLIFAFGQILRIVTHNCFYNIFDNFYVFFNLFKQGYTYERLDGSVRGEERFLAVNNFNDTADTFIFLLSTRAGK